MVWLTVLGAMVILSLTKHMLLPNKFFFDALTIQKGMAWVDGWNLADSFGNTAKLYVMMHLHSVWAVAMFQSLILGALFWRQIKRIKVFYVSDVAIIGLFVIVSAVYLTQFSKDFFTFLLAALFVECIESRAKLLFWTLIACVYGAYFRQYWFLIILVFWEFEVCGKWIKRPGVFIFVFAGTLFVLATAFSVILGLPLDYFRHMVNIHHLASVHSQTLIPAYIEGASILSQWLNGMVVALFFLVPIPLLLHGDIYHGLLACMFVFISSKIVSIYNVLRRNDASVGCWRCVGLLAAFFMIQCVFEPDYGSVLKHLSALSVVVVCLVAKCNTSRMQKREPGKAHADVANNLGGA